jgi:hypothetical protein
MERARGFFVHAGAAAVREHALYHLDIITEKLGEALATFLGPIENQRSRACTADFEHRLRAAVLVAVVVAWSNAVAFARCGRRARYVRTPWASPDCRHAYGATARTLGNAMTSKRT